MTYRSENQVWEQVMGLLNDWVSSQNLTTWIVRQGHQPHIVDITSRLIWVDRISSTRYGWQADKPRLDETSQQMVNDIRYYTDMVFQISFFKRRENNDTVDTLTSSDVANQMLTYLMSETGLANFRALGFGLLRTTELREPIFSDEDDTYERNPNFDITINFEQVQTSNIGSIDSLQYVIKGF